MYRNSPVPDVGGVPAILVIDPTTTRYEWTSLPEVCTDLRRSGTLKPLTKRIKPPVARSKRSKFVNR